MTYIMCTFDDAKKLIDHLNSLIRDEQYVFRGISSKREMFPNLIRKRRMTEYETEFLIEFERHGLQYINTSTPIDLMSHAQHFGIPTRLLDFTFNPFIALYFSLFEDKRGKTDPEEREYYYIAYTKVTDNKLINGFTYKKHTKFDFSYYPDSLSEKARVIIECANNNGDNHHFMISELLDFPVKDQILFINPGNSNPRITMQQGLFMFPILLDDENYKTLIDKQIRYIKIHKNIRHILLKYLNVLGINAYRLMPDLSSVCKAITSDVITKNKEVDLNDLL